MKLKKIPLTLMAIAMASSAFAADMDSRVTALETQLQQVRTETAMGTYGALTASARPEVDGTRFFVMGDILFWHAKVNGTEFAYSDGQPGGSVPIQGRTKDNDFDWDWGFRLGLGYNAKYDGWDVLAQFTAFYTDDSETSSPGDSGGSAGLIPLRGSDAIAGTPSTYTTVQTAKSDFDFDYTDLGVEIGRAYFVSKKLSFRPFMGLRTVWLNLEQEARYTGASIGLASVSVEDKQSFWGMGPRAGWQTKWHLGGNVSIVGDIDAGLYYGFFDISHIEKDSNNTSLDHIDINADKHAFVPNLHFKLGLRYGNYIFDHKQYIAVGLSYESQFLWDANQFIQINDETPAKYVRIVNDVGMYGVTLDLRLDF